MSVIRYSRWDETQTPFSLDTDAALETLSELMMHGLSVPEALEWMRRFGFAMGGASFRVLGTQQLLERLRERLRALFQQGDPSRATDELEQRLQELLTRETDAVERAHGLDSARLNDLLTRRHLPEGTPLSDRIEALRDYPFEDPEAADAYRELLGEVDAIRRFERMMAEHGARFTGNAALDWPEARKLSETITALQQLAENLVRGTLGDVDPSTLSELLDEDGVRSVIILRDLDGELRRRGLLAEDGEPRLTPLAIRKMGATALADVYGALARDRRGEHDTAERGLSIEKPDATRAYTFGDPLDIDVVKTVLNAVQRRAHSGDDPGRRLALTVDDFEVREREFSTQTTTILLLDLSWSMSFGGRFPAAKRVALAMEHLVRTRYPRDHFFVVGFSTEARTLSPRELSEVRWDPSEPFTNLQGGLIVAERLIAKYPARTAQILVITDGQPTAYYQDGQLHAEWPMGPGAISPGAVTETMKQVRAITRRGVTINTFMLDDAPELVGFVERMTEVNRGRAFFAAPEHLGSFMLLDYVKRRRGRR